MRMPGVGDLINSEYQYDRDNQLVFESRDCFGTDASTTFYEYDNFGNITWVEREIRYAINEIYARKGYDFTGTSYERYFAEKDWYHPIVGKQVTEEELNSYEKANIDLLVKIEKEVQAAMPDEA